MDSRVFYQKVGDCQMLRCAWACSKNPKYVQYHDEEWGKPLHGDCKLYELFILECFQAGLSWECVLNKREDLKQAFANFDINKVVKFDEEKIKELLANPNIIRNKIKIKAAIRNSVIFKIIQKEFGSFDKYIWSYTDGKTIEEEYTSRTTSPLSDEISKDLKSRGMTFVGSITIYSFLQACGIINGHSKFCKFYKNS